LGCGRGAVTLRMANIVGAEGEVVGIDLDQSILGWPNGKRRIQICR